MDPSEQRSALIRLGLIVGAGILAAAVTGVTKTVAVVLAIVVMIMLHELGHFATAKWADMKVTEYFLGFGPRLWSIRRGETEYGVKAIPAGGYVKIIGMSNLEEVAPEDEARTYREKPYWRRLSVAVAGSTVHFIFAFILLWLTFSTIGIQGQTPQLKVGELTLFKTGQSPAQQAGFKLGDKIVSVDGLHFKSWDDLPPYIQSHTDQKLTFVVERGGQQVTLTPTPVDRRTIEIQGGDPNKPTEPSGFIGIGPSFPILKYGPISSIGRAEGEFGSEVRQTVDALGSLVTFKGIRGYSSQFTGPSNAPADPNAPRFLSPVGLVRVAGAVAHNGIRDVLRLLIAINIFVGIFNMVPLLPLDGGHVAIATYEKIRSLFRGGRAYHADVAKLMPLTYLVLLLLVGLGASSLYLDIVHPINLH
jgi:membrane-associated protease RseP (regulator of RpoE activity)